ncbi:hypothetical protein [Streptomyces sp. KR80]|uniref:hypothetical protein n=1 Tax=Streptomyces sp. KR80 TaxID=3457426 RepID=UPI003FCEE894
MGWLTPKYPKSDTSGATGTPTTRRERRAAKRQPVDHSTISEADIRQAERNGWRVDRRSRHIVIERTTSNGGYEMRSFTVLGNGRYGKR